MELLFSVVFFGLCMAGMSLGVIVSGRRLRGSCGGAEVLDAHGDGVSCGACPKKASEVCPTDDPLVRLAQIGHPNPEHHR